MAITLGAFTLPDGLRWDDEFSWSETAQNVGYLVSGAALVEESQKLSGRPVTLVGGRRWAWMQRVDVEALHAALTAPGAQFTLTLHDGRQFTVIPRHSGDAALVTTPLPIVSESGPADPVSSSQYVVERLSLMIVG